MDKSLETGNSLMRVIGRRALLNVCINAPERKALLPTLSGKTVQLQD